MCDLETREQFNALGNTEVLEEHEEGDVGKEDEFEERLSDDDSPEILECAHYRKYSKKSTVTYNKIIHTTIILRCSILY